MWKKRKQAGEARRISFKRVLQAQCMMVIGIPLMFVYATGNEHLVPNRMEVFRVTSIAVAGMTPQTGSWDWLGSWFSPAPRGQGSCQKIWAEMFAPHDLSEKEACKEVDKTMTFKPGTPTLAALANLWDRQKPFREEWKDRSNPFREKTTIAKPKPKAVATTVKRTVKPRPKRTPARRTTTAVSASGRR